MLLIYKGIHASFLKIWSLSFFSYILKKPKAVPLKFLKLHLCHHLGLRLLGEEQWRKEGKFGQKEGFSSLQSIFNFLHEYKCLLCHKQCTLCDIQSLFHRLLEVLESQGLTCVRTFLPPSPHFVLTFVFYSLLLSLFNPCSSITNFVICLRSFRNKAEYRLLDYRSSMKFFKTDSHQYSHA